MGEKKKLVFFLIILVLLIGAILFSGKIKDLNSNKIVEKVEKLYNDEKISLIYLGRDDCSYCERFTPVINSLKEKYKFDYTYININKLKSEDLISVINILSLDINQFGTPTLAIVQSSKLIGTQNGYTDESGLFEVLQYYGIISKEIKNPYFADDSDVVVKDFLEQFNSVENTLIYIGRPTCTFCQKLNVILEKLVDERSLKYYYINSDEISSSQLGAILSKLGVLTSNFGTPYLAVVAGGKVIDEQPGYVEESYLIEFLTENKIIN